MVQRGLNWLDVHYIQIVTIVVLLIYGMTYLARPMGDPIRSDAGYYMYLPSLVLHADPTFEKDAEQYWGGDIPRWTYVRVYPPSGNYLNAINMGVSLLVLPFFLTAHVLTIWFGFPWAGGPEFLKMRYALDGYSFFYQHGAGLAGVTYFLIGLSLLKAWLRRFFERGPVLAALTATLLGTNLLYYATADTVTAHPFTFFLAVALIRLTDRWYRRPASWGCSIGLGIVAALLFLVRPLNVMLLAWPILYGMVQRSDVQTRLQLAWKHKGMIAIMAVAALLVCAPQLAMWKVATGHWLVKSYQHMDSSHFGMPQLVAVLFGIQKGMFIWFPVTILAMAGLRALWLTARPLFFPVLAIWIMYPLVIGSYQDWLTAGGFGNRYVVDMTAAAAIALSAFYAHLHRPWHRWLWGSVTATFILWSLFLLTLFFRREILGDGLDAQALFDIFWWRKEALLQWWAQ